MTGVVGVGVIVEGGTGGGVVGTDVVGGWVVGAGIRGTPMSVANDSAWSLTTTLVFASAIMCGT